MTSAGEPPLATHTETIGSPITINIPDHPGRAETPGFVASKNLAKKILATIAGGIPGAQLHVFDPGAHMITVERPDEVTRLLLEHF